MNEVVTDILKEQPIVIPKVLLKYYTKLNITEEEFIILICIMNKGNKIVYDPGFFTEEIGMKPYRAMQILNDLSEKAIIEIKLENNPSGKKEEYIYLDLLYNKLFNIIIDKNHEATINTDLFTLFETELGRTISPMEVEIIKEWLHDGNSEELIKEALKEAIYNNARNLKYIDRILFNWRTKGINSKKDILEEKKNYRKTIKPKEPIYDYNWLEDE